MNPITICISGIDGAGKNTLIHLLSDDLKASGKSVSEVTVWDWPGQMESPILEKPEWTVT